MVDWSVATSRLLAPLLADCKSFCSSIKISSTALLTKTMDNSFAFVEYEDRRDADEAYHDMHNRRLGRDDILKIEVSSQTWASPTTSYLTFADVVGSYSSFCFMALRSK
jgi:hypothetical protein